MKAAFLWLNLQVKVSIPQQSWVEVDSESLTISKGYHIYYYPSLTSTLVIKIHQHYSDVESMQSYIPYTITEKQTFHITLVEVKPEDRKGNCGYIPKLREK